MRLGAHLSIAGGLPQALKSAQKIGAKTVQIFSSSPRSWQGPTVGNSEIKKFKTLAKKNNIKPIFIHAKYLVNLGSDNPQTINKSKQSLIIDLKLAAQIKARGVIFHPLLKNFSPLISNIKKVLQQTPASTSLILENSAQMKLADIGRIIKTVKNKRLKFCLDIAHAFQAGYNLKKPSQIKKVLDIIKTKIGFQRWLVIHANDSQTSCGSFHDRHENIGQGKIGPLPFSLFLNHPFSANLPFILETPGFRTEGLKSDQLNLLELKKLAGQRLKKDFFLQPTLKVAQQLIGQLLVVKQKNNFQLALIKETEAYIGTKDKACHAAKGKTKRNEVMFGPPGRLYIYLVYGLHYMLNIVTEKKGFPAAVLIRSLQPLLGIKNKVNGPGKLTKELKINKSFNGIDTSSQKAKIYLKNIGLKPKIISKKRVGIDYAGQWADKKWRFLIAQKQPF